MFFRGGRGHSRWAGTAPEKEGGRGPRRRTLESLTVMRAGRRQVLKVPLTLAGLAICRGGWAGETEGPNAAGASERQAPVIVLQPLGATLDAEEVAAVSAAIAAFYAVTVSLAPPL